MKQVWMGAAVLGAALIVGPTFAHAQQAQDIGKDEYLTSCAVCHGTSGKGGGPLEGWLKKPAADLTKIQKNNAGVFPFDRMYQIIDGRQAVAAHGTRDMPVWGAEYKYEAGWRMGVFLTQKDVDSFIRGRIIALIGYIYSLQEK